MAKKGNLILENGQILEGLSFGKELNVSGEVVFNTGMVGYPEGFTDPSYYGQILTMTFPLIGNYGVPSTESKQELASSFESTKIHIRALIVTRYVKETSHWQSTKSLGDWLKEENIPALEGIDTRALTKIIREKGVMKGKITFDSKELKKDGFTDINSQNLVEIVSPKSQKTYGSGKIRILFFDCGAKLNQIRLLLDHDVTIVRVPWNFNPFTEKTSFDAAMISNGPGDPKMAYQTVKNIREIIKREIPILGVCLGNQILALAAGANTYKLKYGHRGQNQPVKDEKTGKCYITTQNHGFAVDTNSLPEGWQPWFTNLNDGTNEGIRNTKIPFFSTQFHPEDMPGPTDTRWIFEYFLEEVTKWKKRN